MLRTVVGLAGAAHLGPSFAVTGISVALGVGVGLDPWRLAVLGMAVLCDQLSVGLSNDWRDAERDRAVARSDKPVARGQISTNVARTAAISFATLAILMTIPLGLLATIVHAVALGSAWAYNFGLKSSAFSVLPYIVSFSLLPLVVGLAASPELVPSPWILVAAGLLGASAHFANALPDLEDDQSQGVLGLPHRIGARATVVVSAFALLLGSASLVLTTTDQSVFALGGFVTVVVIAVVLLGLALRTARTRLAFRLIIFGAFINVFLMLTAGSGWN